MKPFILDSRPVFTFLFLKVNVYFTSYCFDCNLFPSSFGLDYSLSAKRESTALSSK